MASSNGPDPDGGNPWGSPGQNPRPGGPGRRGEDPWGDPRPGPGPGGPRGGGNGPLPQMPDLDRIIAQMQAGVRRFLGGGGRQGPGGGGHGLTRGRGILLLGIAVVAIWLLSGFYRVEPDQEGVVLRFGAFTRLTPPGLNYHLPWPIEAVDTPAVTRINRIEIGYRSGKSSDDEGTSGPSQGGGREVAQESLMLTGDENIVDVNVVVLWRIDNVVSYLFNTRDPRTTIKSVTESVLREVFGRTPIQPALGPLRAQIADDVMRQTQKILDSYHAGVQIVQVLPQKVDPPDAVIESFRDVQRANTDAERLRNQAEAYANNVVPRAHGEAARIEAIAQGDKQATIAKATGEAKRFESVLAAYQTAKDITLKRLYLDTMQDVLTHSQTTVLDDKLRGLVPLLSVTPQGAAPSAAPALAKPPPAPSTTTPSVASAGDKS